MAQYVLVVYEHCGRCRTHIHKHAASPLACIIENAVGKCQRSDVEFGNLYPCLVETVGELVVERFAPQDVEEVSSQLVSLNSCGVVLVVIAHFVFLYGNIKDLLV